MEDFIATTDCISIATTNDCKCGLAVLLSKTPLLPTLDCIGVITVGWCVIVDYIATFDCIPVL